MVLMMINIKLLGELKISLDSVDITTKLSKKGVGILIYMATNSKKLFYRETLASMFWMDYTKESSLNNLRYTLWQIRKLTKQINGEELFTNSGKHAIKINESQTNCDYVDFLAHVDSKEYKDASSLYLGDFIESFYIPDVPDFSDWVFNQREHAQRLYFDVQLDLAAESAANKNLKEAIQSLNKLINIDPLNEVVYYHQMEYHYLSGNKVTAINAYRNLKQNLREELNISPSEDIHKLYLRISKELDCSTEIANPLKPVFTDESTNSKYTSTDSNEIKIYISSKSEEIRHYANQLCTYNRNKEQLIFDICDSPGLRINYEGLFEIIDDLETFGEYTLQFKSNEFRQISSDIKTTKVDEDLFLFKQFETLLNHELSQKHIFRIWNLHFLDSKTIDFISYLFRKKTTKDIQIIGFYDDSWDNIRLDHFIKAHESFDNNNINIIRHMS